MNRNVEFSDMFKKDDLDEIVAKVENLISLAAPHEKDYHMRNFTTNLFKLGVRIQNEEYLSRAKQLISNYSLLNQSDIYRQISESYFKRGNQIKGRQYLETAFNQWRESLYSRRVTDPSDILKMNLTDMMKLAQKGSEMMSPTDYFRHDLQILESLYAGEMHESFKTCIKLSLTFIESSPLFFQPLMLAFLADHLIGKEDKKHIIQHLNKADEIIKDAEVEKVGIPIFSLSGGWSQYYQEKAKILRKLGDVEESSKLLGDRFDSSKEDLERWRFDENQLDQCLFLGDAVKIQEIIDIGLKNLYNPIVSIPFTFVYPLIKEKPSKGVKQEIWVFARNYLKEKLSEIASSFNPEQRSALRYDYLVEVLKFLISLETSEVVRETSYKIINTLQEALRTLASQDLKQNIEFLSTDFFPWNFGLFLNLTLSRSNLLFVQTRADYWDYYKVAGKNAEVKYDQFDTTYKKWFREHRTGNPNNMHLYINIPYVFDSLIEIFEKMGEENLVSLCRRNVEIFRIARLNEVQKEPSSGKEDRSWYSNLLTLIKIEMEEFMKAHNYVAAKERFNQVFELLELEGVKRKDQSDGLALDPLYLSVIRMFELLTKY